MKASIHIILLFLFAFAGCKDHVKTTQEDFFEPNLAALFVKDIDASIDWYKEKLEFKIEKEVESYPDYGLKIAFLELDGFHLEIIEKTNSFEPAEITPNEDQYIGGVFKIGFKTDDIEGLYNRLKGLDGVELITDIGTLDDPQIPIAWPSKYFLIKDVDGNFIQFFDSRDTKGISPWLTMVTVDNLENSMAWYSQTLGFEHYQTVGDIGNRRAVLGRNNYVLELWEPSHVIKANQIAADSTVLGFSKIAFGVENLVTISLALKERNTDIVMPLEKSDFDWARQAMMVKDPDGNWTQLFEVKTNN